MSEPTGPVELIAEVLVDDEGGSVPTSRHIDLATEIVGRLTEAGYLGTTPWTVSVLERGKAYGMPARLISPPQHPSTSPRASD